MRERLTRRDWLFVAICAAITAVSVFVALRWFSSAFPEASIEFRYDRRSSQPVAERVMQGEGIDTKGLKHTAIFDTDNNAKVFLERSLGLEKTNAILRRSVHIWFWHHRWFRPLQEEEYAVDVAPTGEIVSFNHHIPEERALPAIDPGAARQLAEAFLTRVGAGGADLQLVAQSERKLPKRIQRIFTYDSRTIRPAGAPYRHTVIVDGNTIGRYEQRVKVPEQWQRTYSELRSKNALAGTIDFVFLAVTMVAAVVVFVIRLRRGDLPVRFLIIIGAVSAVLSAGVAANSFPSELAGYDTTTSYAAFLAQFLILGVFLRSLATAMLLLLICGAGEVLYRERLPQHLAMPRIWTPRALTSKRVFRSFVLGYTLVAFFLAYQVAFYIVAGRFGAWAPADIPYDDIVNTAIPWIAVLFAGFFPALSEEFLSRAFSIPFFQRFLRPRVAAIVAAGFIWGFGHATYPNQPFFIRGVEVGVAGVLIGFLFDSFGLLPLLIWHYTVDALYTALILFRSGNTYYIASAGAASLIFAIPMLVSIVLYIRNKGFIPDDDLTNAAMPVHAPPPAPEAAPAAVELPPRRPVTGVQLAVCAIAVAIAAALLATRPKVPEDAIDYKIAKERAKEIAAAHLRAATGGKGRWQRVIASPIEGFRSWSRDSPREDGGAPGPFDAIAATYLVEHGLPIEGLIDAFRHRIEAGTWTVRFFTPSQKEEYFAEVDPRTSRVLGYHKYQDERNPGPRLEQADAPAIATRAFAAYGVDGSQFDLKEALSFQQPNRRDWLFHFQERTPIAAEGFRRATIRVAGNEVTQFTKTVKVPDVVYRQPTTLLNVTLVVLRIAGTILLLALVVTGFVLVTRKGHFPWRRAAKWALVLAPIPIVLVLARYEDSLFSYNTSVGWETFTIGLATQDAMSIVFRVALLFLALAGMQAAVPYALDLLSRQGRARTGRAAAIAAVTAVALFAALRVAFVFAARLFPSAARITGLNIPDEVALPVPALLAVFDALYDAVLFSGALALFAVGLHSLRRWPWIPAVVSIGTIFCILIDADVTAAQAPLVIARALAAAVAAWAIVRYVLDDHLLAYPLAVFTATALQAASGMLANHRPDLQVNGAVAAAAVAAALLWTAIPRSNDA